MPRLVAGLALASAAAALTLIALATVMPAPSGLPVALKSELADGPVTTVRQSEENIIGSLGVEPSRKSTTAGMLADPDLVADGEMPAAEPASEEAESAADATEYADTGEEKEGVVPSKAAWNGGRTNYNKATSAAADLDKYFDNLPVHDVTPDHLPEGSKEVVTRQGQREVTVESPQDARFNNEPDSATEWEDKMKNLDEAVHLYNTQGDAALEAAVKEGLTKEPYEPGELDDAVPQELTRRLASPTGNKVGGIDGLRAVQYKKLVDNIQGSLVKERQIMAKLRRDVAAKKAEQAAAVNGDSERGGSVTEAAKAAINKYDDKTLDFNAAGSSYYDEYSNFNPPISGEPKTIPYHGADEEEPQQGADAGKSTVGLGADKTPSQLGFIGGAGVEGGQGNSDSIYGSHDDHSTYGVSGTGWQGPGNGEAPGDLWNPAKGQRSAGLTEPAAAKTDPGSKSLSDLSNGLAGSVKAISHNMLDERKELEEAEDTLKHTESVIDRTLHAGDAQRQEWVEKSDKMAAARAVFRDLKKQQEEPAAEAAATVSKKGRKTTTLSRINKIDEPSADLNPNWSPGWVYDEYSNFNPPADGEPEMVKAGGVNAKYGFKTWKGPTNSYSPPIHGGRYGDGNEMDATPMSAIFKSPKQTALAMKNDELAMDIDQKQLRLAEGTLAAMTVHTLKHHDKFKARKDSHSPKEQKAEEEWEKADIIRTKKQRKLIDDLSEAVRSEQLQLNMAEKSMVQMEMVSTASLATKLKAHKAQQEHALSRAGGKQGKAAVAQRIEDALHASAVNPPGVAPTKAATGASKVGWVKKAAGGLETAFKGLSDKRSSLPSKKEMRAAIHHHRRGRGMKQQQLAAAAPSGAEGGAAVKQVAAKASGFGICALFGIACS